MIFDMKVEWIEKWNMYRIWIGKEKLKDIEIMKLLNLR